MRKFIVFVIAFCLIPCFCYAKIDYRNMTLEELIDIRQQALNAMYEKDGWQNIIVPCGIYYVGIDIPSGIWDIKCSDAEDQTFTYISYGYETRKDGSYSMINLNNNVIRVYKEGVKNTDTDGLTSIRVTLKEGMIIAVIPTFAPAIFTPYIGNDIFFK